MTSFLEQNIKKTIDNQIDNWRLAEHLRLLGFHNIVNDVNLDKYKVEEYLTDITPKYPSFTPLTSGNFLMANKKAVERHELSSVHLPFIDTHHLLFFLKSKNKFMQEFLYDSCEDCKILNPGSFPMMELRGSVNLPGSGAIMYDNRLSIRQQDEKMLEQQYDAIEKFVNATKLTKLNY